MIALFGISQKLSDSGNILELPHVEVIGCRSGHLVKEIEKEDWLQAGQLKPEALCRSGCSKSIGRNTDTVWKEQG